MNPLLIRVLLAAGLLLASGAAGWHTGAKLEREQWEAEKIALQQAQQKAILDQVAKNDAILKDQQAKARKASDDYEKALTDLRDKYAHVGGLRISRSICDPAPDSTKAAGSSRSDETGSSTVELPQRTEDDLYALAKRADELAEQLRALQSWIKENGLYGDAQ